MSFATVGVGTAEGTSPAFFRDGPDHGGSLGGLQNNSTPSVSLLVMGAESARILASSGGNARATAVTLERPREIAKKAIAPRRANRKRREP